jgi:hypothetical protein
MYDAVL